LQSIKIIMPASNRLLILFFFLLIFPACVNNKWKSHNGEPKAKNFTIFKTKRGERIYLKAYDSALSLWTEPKEEVIVKTSFGKAHVIISGPTDAPPLVLLHGMNASSTMWYPNISSFSKKYRVYAIDFILEVGKSVSSGEIKDKDEVVKWYNEIFDHFKFKKISIVGASRGGWLTVNLALYSKARIEKIVLLSPAMTFTSIKPKKKVLSNLIYNVHPRRKRLRKVLQTLSANVDNIKQLFINQYYIGTRTSKRNKGMMQMRTFSDDELKSLHIPVLLLIGDHDIINNEKSIEKAKSLVPHLKAYVIKNAGHFLSLDQPEIVDKMVMDFLSGNK
jgi:pimeloyl-ACP methyl ester carboxylesterase